MEKWDVVVRRRGRSSREGTEKELKELKEGTGPDRPLLAPSPRR